MGEALCNIPHKLVDQDLLRELGHPYYNSRAQGGEGHLEVGKNIYYYQKGLCHMVLSLKPFGCMPSTQSDGAQAGVQGAYGDMIFLPIETSGEGEVNAHSRVQMALGEAKQKTRKEYQKSLDDTKLTPEEVATFIKTHPQLKRPSYKVPQHEKTIGVAANTVYHVKELMA
jgi:predicted nucleotide-binding protein (sugar kinase/HSP70/actin superfamily)